MATEFIIDEERLRERAATQLVRDEKRGKDCLPKDLQEGDWKSGIGTVALRETSLFFPLAETSMGLALCNTVKKKSFEQCLEAGCCCGDWLQNR